MILTVSVVFYSVLNVAFSASDRGAVNDEGLIVLLLGLVLLQSGTAANLLRSAVTGEYLLIFVQSFAFSSILIMAIDQMRCGFSLFSLLGFAGVWLLRWSLPKLSKNTGGESSGVGLQLPTRWLRALTTG